MDMNYCEYCNLCKEFEIKKNILYQTESLFVAPSIGQIVEGYLLICSKKHYISLGSFPENLFSELEKTQKLVKKVLSENYIAPIFFEHGPASAIKKGGCCIEHAHLHAVPVDVDVSKELSKYFKPEPINNLVELRAQFQTGIPYFFYENRIGKRFVFPVSEIVPSQYIRRIIAVKIGRKDKWSWKQCPEMEKFNRTIEKLKNKFKQEEK